MIECNTFYNATFISDKEYCGFKRNKNYTISIKENLYGITLTSIDEEDETKMCPYCNIKSMERAWRINE